MDRFDARREGALSHGGTFNGNPVGGGRRPRDAARADARPLRAARRSRRSPRERGSRTGFAAAGLDARVDGDRLALPGFAGPTPRGRPTGTRRRRRCSSGSSSTASTSRRGAWARSRHRRPRRTSTTSPMQSSIAWPRCSPPRCRSADLDHRDACGARALCHRSSGESWSAPGRHRLPHACADESVGQAMRLPIRSRVSRWQPLRPSSSLISRIWQGVPGRPATISRSRKWCCRRRTPTRTSSARR